jgi:outer membrane protein assembly factor BamB
VSGDNVIQVGGVRTDLLTAIDMDSGHVVWTRAMGGPVDRLDGVNGDLIVGVNPGFQVAPQDPPDQETQLRAMAAGRTMRLDARTGDTIWEHTGSLLNFAANAVLVSLQEPAVGQTGWRLIGIDPVSGRDRWELATPKGFMWTFGVTDSGDMQDDRLVLSESSTGSIIFVDTLTGQTTRPGTIEVGAAADWIWRGLLGVHTSLQDGQQKFAVYDLARLGGAPLWSKNLSQDYGSYWPCSADRLCLWSETGRTMVDPLTGGVVGFRAHQEISAIDGTLDIWRSGGQYDDGHLLLTAMSAATKTHKAWLGIIPVGDDPSQVKPLMELPASVDTCWVWDQWIYCPPAGSGPAYSIRKSEVDALIRRLDQGR